MSYLEGLLFDPNARRMDETRQGIPIFNGTPQYLPEWKFKVETKIKAVKAIADVSKREEFKVKLLSDIIDGLRGDALNAAMDMGDSLLSLIHI